MPYNRKISPDLRFASPNVRGMMQQQAEMQARQAAAVQNQRGKVSTTTGQEQQQGGLPMPPGSNRLFQMAGEGLFGGPSEAEQIAQYNATFESPFMAAEAANAGGPWNLSGLSESYSALPSSNLTAGFPEAASAVPVDAYNLSGLYEPIAGEALTGAAAEGGLLGAEAGATGLLGAEAIAPALATAEIAAPALAGAELGALAAPAAAAGPPGWLLAGGALGLGKLFGWI